MTGLVAFYLLSLAQLSIGVPSGPEPILGLSPVYTRPAIQSANTTKGVKFNFKPSRIWNIADEKPDEISEQLTYLFEREIETLPKMPSYPQFFREDTGTTMHGNFVRYVMLFSMMDVFGGFPNWDERILFLAINMVDRTLDKRRIKFEQLDTVCMSALFIANKFETRDGSSLNETLKHIHEAPKFLSEFRPNVTKEGMIQAEPFILNAIGHRVDSVTPIDYLIIYRKKYRMLEGPFLIAQFVASILILSPDCALQRPSLIAAASLYTTHAMLKNEGKYFWSEDARTTLFNFSNDKLQFLCKIFFKVLQNTEDDEIAFAGFNKDRLTMRHMTHAFLTELRADYGEDCDL